MEHLDKPQYERVLIASANPLFGKGLEKMIRKQRSTQALQIHLVASNAEMLLEMEDWQPDLVLVDYDDKSISRVDFLQKFVDSEYPAQVMLVSLKANGVVVYDRRTMTPAQAEDWLNLP
jgi:cytochrome c oxidase subunit 2